MSEDEKATNSLPYKEEEEDFELENRVDADQLSEKSDKTKKMTDKIENDTSNRKRRRKKKKRRYSRFFDTSLDNVSPSTNDTNGRLNSTRIVITGIRRSQLVGGTEESGLGQNNMAQCNELCSSNACFSSEEVKTDNLVNCSVRDENIAVVCQEQVEFDKDEENGLN